MLLESAGRPDAVAGGDPANAAGLTQIVAETGPEPAGHAHRPRGLAAADRPPPARAAPRPPGRRGAGAGGAAARGRALRPRARAGGAVRYLRDRPRAPRAATTSRVVSYHMGIGNLERRARAPTASDEPALRAAVLRLHAAAPRRAPGRAWRALGDDSSTYLWRVLAAREIMRLHREDPRGAAAAGERCTTPRPRPRRCCTRRPRRRSSPSPSDVAEARDDGRAARAALAGARSGLRPRPRAWASWRRGWRSARRCTSPCARRRSPPPATWPRACGASAGEPEPLTMTSAVRDQAYQRLLTATQPGGHARLLAAHDRLRLRPPAPLSRPLAGAARCSSCSTACSRST